MKPENLDNFQQQDFSADYRLRAILSMVPKCSGRVLDIGSGNGTMAIFLSRWAKSVLATEKSSVLLKKLRQKTHRILNLRIKEFDAEDFNLEERNFDLITACDVIEHLENDLGFLKNCYRYLTKNGKLFLSVPAVKFLYGSRDRKYGHYRRYRKKEIMQKVQAAGFRIWRCQYWNLIGFFPYLVSEKIFGEELIGPAREKSANLWFRILNQLLYLWLLVESKINFLPIGLSLIILAGKNETEEDSSHQ